MKERLRLTLKYIKKISLTKLIAFIVGLTVLFSMTFLLHLFDIESAMIYYSQVNSASTSIISSTNANIVDFASLFSQTNILASQANAVTSASTTIASTNAIVSPAQPDIFNLLFNGGTQTAYETEQLKQFFNEAKIFNTNLNSFIQQRFNSLNKLFEHSLVVGLSIYVSVQLLELFNIKKEKETSNNEVNKYTLETPVNKYIGHFSKSAFLTNCHLTC